MPGPRLAAARQLNEDPAAMRSRSMLIVLFWPLVLAAGAFASTEPHPRVRAVWTETPPVIDGRLDDAVWADAAVVDDFTQAVPVKGATPSQRTVVRILTDRDHLYFAIRCYDTDPEKIVANRMLRDDTLFWEDRFNIAIDTFHDRRNGYFFQINAHGARRDGIVEGPNFEKNWDAIWFVKARIDAEGWSAEVAIPYKSLPSSPQIATTSPAGLSF
jgi:hypothetical protein